MSRYMLPLLILLIVLTAFGSAVMPLDFGVGKESGQVSGPSAENQTETILIYDPSAARGAALILLTIGEQGMPHALYLVNPAEIDDNLPLASPSEAFSILADSFSVDHYVSVNLQVLDEIAASASLDQLPPGELTPHTLAMHLVRETAATGLQTLTALHHFLAEVETSLTPQETLRLGVRLNQQMPLGVVVHTSAEEYQRALPALREGG